jgi:hypothetical protein
MNAELKALKTSEIRGFNYDGSWGSSGLDVWLYQ